METSEEGIGGSHTDHPMDSSSVRVVANRNVIDRSLAHSFRWRLRDVLSGVLIYFIFVGIGLGILLCLFHSMIVPLPIAGDVISEFSLNPNQWEYNIRNSRRGDLAEAAIQHRVRTGDTNEEATEFVKGLWSNVPIFVGFAFFLLVLFWGGLQRWLQASRDFHRRRELPNEDCFFTDNRLVFRGISSNVGPDHLRIKGARHRSSSRRHRDRVSRSPHRHRRQHP